VVISLAVLVLVAFTIGPPGTTLVTSVAEADEAMGPTEVAIGEENGAIVVVVVVRPEDVTSVVVAVVVEVGRGQAGRMRVVVRPSETTTTVED